MCVRCFVGPYIAAPLCGPKAMIMTHFTHTRRRRRRRRGRSSGPQLISIFFNTGRTGRNRTPAFARECAHAPYTYRDHNIITHRHTHGRRGRRGRLRCAVMRASNALRAGRRAQRLFLVLVVVPITERAARSQDHRRDHGGSSTVQPRRAPAIGIAGIAGILLRSLVRRLMESCGLDHLCLCVSAR